MNFARIKFRPATTLALCIGVCVAGVSDEGFAAKREKKSSDDQVQRLQLQAEPVVSRNDETPKRGKVVEVLKGDELILEDGWVVRMIGVDVPTADFGKRSGSFYGKAALELVKDKVLGQVVTLKYDEQAMDAYDRLLAYVHTKDGENLNVALVSKGLALAACYPPNTSMCSKLAKHQKTAASARLGIWDFNPEDWPKSGSSENILEGVIVRKVIDGDTIQLEDGTIVRYIGIDAPESETSWKKGSFGHDSYEANRKLVEGKKVSLEYDVEFSDPRGRELAYVYVEKDGKKVMVNEELVRAGVAWVAVFPPNIRHIRKLYEAQETGFSKGAGVWKK